MDNRQSNEETKERNLKTQTFSIRKDRDMPMKELLRTVYDALVEGGYDPIVQLVGYILSEDPTYITKYNNARSLIRKIDRDELMEELIRSYLKI